jgi:UDP-3-O-[3-hydroxymyristoyl] glucosamine N-acyltransferase
VGVTVRELADLVAGKVVGDGDCVITAARALDEAQSGDVTFVEDEKHARYLHGCRASAVVVPATIPVNGQTLIQVADPLAAFVVIVRRLHGREAPPCRGIDPLASIHATARLGDGCSLYPFAVVGEGSVLGARCHVHSGAVVGRNCRLGDDVVLYPNVVLYDESVLGNRVVVHSNAVLGADGFGYRVQGGKHVKVPQLGHVEIGDDVEIGACATVDRGTFQATRVGPGTKIDNLVMIGHNCQIGRHNLLVSQVGIAGSCTTGDYVVMAGQVGVADHIHCGDGCRIGAQSGVMRDVPAGERILGAPGRPERDEKRILLSLEHLPGLIKEVRRIKQKLGIKDDAA